MDVKNIFASKSVWFGILYVLVSIAGAFGFTDFKPDQNTVEIGGVITGAIIIVLRMMTDKGVTLR